MTLSIKTKALLTAAALVVTVGVANIVITTNSHKSATVKEDIDTVAVRLTQSAYDASEAFKLYSDLMYKYEGYDDSRIETEMQRLKNQLNAKGVIDKLKSDRVSYDLTISRIGQDLPSGTGDDYGAIKEALDAYRGLVEYVSTAPQTTNRVAYIGGYQELQRKFDDSLNVVAVKVASR